MNQHQVIDRDIAKFGGLAKYFTGKPCRRGHLSLRYTASGQCTTCCENRRRGTLNASSTIVAGVQPVPFLVHGDDVVVVQRLVDALAYARTLTTNQG